MIIPVMICKGYSIEDTLEYKYVAHMQMWRIPCIITSKEWKGHDDCNINRGVF